MISGILWMVSSQSGKDAICALGRKRTYSSRETGCQVVNAAMPHLLEARIRNGDIRLRPEVTPPLYVTCTKRGITAPGGAARDGYSLVARIAGRLVANGDENIDLSGRQTKAGGAASGAWRVNRYICRTENVRHLLDYNQFVFRLVDCITVLSSLVAGAWNRIVGSEGAWRTRNRRDLEPHRRVGNDAVYQQTLIGEHEGFDRKCVLAECVLGS